MGILSRSVLGEIMRSAVLFLAIVVLGVSGQTDPAIEEKAVPGVEEHDCGDWTALQPVKIGSGETKMLTTSKNTKRCIMRYKKDAGCKEMAFTCSKFFVDNKDWAPVCRDGDRFIIKSDNRIKKFCGKQKNQLTSFLPAYSRNIMKVWFIPDMDHKKFNSAPLRCCMTCSA